MFFSCMTTISIFEQIEKNKRSSILLFSLFIPLIGGMGFIFGQQIGNPFLFTGGALVFALISSLVSYFTGDKIVLAVSGAKQITHDDHPRLFNIVEEMSISAGIPIPKIYIITDDDAPNAFATGRNPEHASVAVTTALLNRLNRDELQGVIAHELSHIQNFDIRFAMLISVMVGMVAMMCDMFRRYLLWGGGRRSSRDNDRGSGQIQLIIFIAAIVLSIIAPLFAMIIQFSISRQREYLADANGARLTRYPEGLASALEKISADPGKLEASNRATQHLYFVNPLKALKQTSGIFDTHPPIAERVLRLRSMN